MAAQPQAAWMSVDELNQSDFDQAQAEYMPMFGSDPTLWPDWLDREAVLLPAGGGSSWLVVRVPVKAECGGYNYIVFGPAPREGERPKLGEPICAGDMQVQPRRGQVPPDLLFTGPASLDESVERPVQRWHWTGKAWVIVKR
ncbi:MAG TPA: hypothetical protein VK558_00975 [Patescibacteria group bacterium]|nr:hypothetical protein [Patescibacteria group bacterium]